MRLRRRSSDSTRVSPLRRFTYECLAVAAVLPVLLAWLATQSGLWHANALVHDEWIAHNPTPAPHELVVIALDEPCPPMLSACAALPMRYQELLRHLQAYRPRAVLLDTRVLQTSGQNPTRTAAALQASAGAVPVFTTLLQNEDGLPVDRDGIVRRLLPQVPGAGGAQPHAVLNMLDIPAPPGGWPQALHLRWRPAAEAPPAWSYADVLLGNLPPDALRGKLVVAGPRVSAQAGAPLLVRVGTSTHTLPLADAYAQALHNLQHEHWVRHLPDNAGLLWIALPVWLAAALCLRRPEHAAQRVMGTALLTTAISAYAMLAHRWWLPLATPLAGMLLFLLVCSWRHSRALSSLFSHRIQRLRKLLGQMPSDADPREAVPVAAPPLGLQQRSRVEVLDQTLERLEAQHQIQRRMQQQRDRWLGFLSHDLRAPQANILNLLELRAHGVQGMTDERFYAGVRLQVDRTLRLAEGFVDLLRAESDHLNRQHCALEHLTEEAIDRCWPQAQAAQVKLVERRATVPGGEVCNLYADPELLTRAMVNVLTNAVRHSPPGSQVEVCVARDPDTHQVAWSVRDHGIGMDAISLADLMQSLDSQTRLRPRSGHEAAAPGARASGHGLGLGLLVAHTVVARHAGDMFLLAAPNVGCQFVMLLPGVESEPAAPPSATQGSASPLRRENPAGATRALPA